MKRRTISEEVRHLWKNRINQKHLIHLEDHALFDVSAQHLISFITFVTLFAHT